MKSIISDKNPHSGDTVHEYEVYKMLSAIKKTSPGVDGVPYWVYKHCAIELSPILTYLKIVNNGNPSMWLKALVTPVPKKTPPTDFSHLRPISITSIMSSVTERLIVCKYPLPALPSDQILDQYAYKPSGSSTSASIAIIHHISCLLESSSYVRCIFIGYSKAFDIINNVILFQKLQQLTISPNVQLWIINFLSELRRSLHAAKLLVGYRSPKASYPVLVPIFTWCMLQTCKLCCLTMLSLSKLTILHYSLLVGQHSSVDIQQEYNICSWSARNRLTINSDKTTEIVFHQPASRHLNIPPPL